MSTNNIDDLYVRHIKPLPRADRIELMARVAQDLADNIGAQTEAGARRSIMELHGLGKEEWDNHSR